MQHLNVSFQPAMIEVPLVSLFQNENLCKIFYLKMSFICISENGCEGEQETRFHTKCCTKIHCLISNREGLGRVCKLWDWQLLIRAVIKSTPRFTNPRFGVN